jgi:hypothetical protein
MSIARYIATLGKLLSSSGQVTGAGLASTAIADNLGYTPAPYKTTSSASPTSSGGVWHRVARLDGRVAYRVSVGTTGGWNSPGMTSFVCHRGWADDLTVGGKVQLGSQQCTKIRANSASADGEWYLELYNLSVPVGSLSSGVYQGFDWVQVEQISGLSTVKDFGWLAYNPASLGHLNEVTL